MGARNAHAGCRGRDGVERVLAALRTHYLRNLFTGNQSAGEKMRCWISLR
jgi:hypothetical protein